MHTVVREAKQQDVIAEVEALVASLDVGRRRLARRFDDMERELQALTGRLNASEPQLRDIRSHVGPR